MNWKIIIGVVILMPVVLHIVYAIGVSPMANNYITVDEYAARSANTPIRVGGQVVPGSIQWDNPTRALHFQITGDKAVLNIVYRAPAPDAFRDGVTAILDGARASNGSFTATMITVKCPHQYLPAY